MPGLSAYLKNPAFLISYFLLLTSYLLPLSIHSSFLFFSSCTNISRSESKDKRIYYFFIYYLLFKMPGYSAYLKTRHFLFLISYSLPLTSFHSFLISQSSFLFLTSYSLPLTSSHIPHFFSLPLTPYLLLLTHSSSLFLTSYLLLLTSSSHSFLIFISARSCTNIFRSEEIQHSVTRPH